MSLKQIPMGKTISRVICIAFASLLCHGVARSQTPAPAAWADTSATKIAAGIASLSPQDNYALPWRPIQESNILWKKRVWRDIDVQEAANAVYNYSPENPGKSLAELMLQGFFDSKYKAYDAVDDKFTTQLSKEAFIALLTPGNKGVSACFNPQKITGFRIKEDWLFLKEEHKMVVRILGLAPMGQVINADGSITSQPLFWLYYPDIRTYLADHKAYMAQGKADMTWDQQFESRNFKSVINKVEDKTTTGSAIQNVVPLTK